MQIDYRSFALLAYPGGLRSLVGGYSGLHRTFQNRQTLVRMDGYRPDRR